MAVRPVLANISRSEKKVALRPVLGNISGCLALTLEDLERLSPHPRAQLEEGLDVLTRRKLIRVRRIVGGDDSVFSITAEGVAVNTSAMGKKLTPRKRISNLTNMVETAIDSKIALKAVENRLAVTLTDLSARLSVASGDLRPVMTVLTERNLVKAKELPGDDEVIYHITAAGVRELAEQEERNWRGRL